ncbi:MAG TPA: DUF1080 domain-containing protein [Chitinophagaceae bacterium]|nr:DUF1080 domain-containing protein [Chitinophagaceae bacterium]
MKRLMFFVLGIFTIPVFSARAQQAGDPKSTEVWEPIPKMVNPGKQDHQPPSDAIVLFNGKDLSEWTTMKGERAQWNVRDNSMIVTKGTGNIRTKRSFGDCQLHIEWQAPAVIESEGQGRGNSGVFLMGMYEVQILDSYNNRTYSNGQAGSLYKQHIPLVNASRPPGEWQSYDIIFTAPRFNSDGSLQSPAYCTVFHNGVLIQNHVELKGGTVYIGPPSYKKHAEKEPLMLQDHGNPVQFRNIWIREL